MATAGEPGTDWVHGPGICIKLHGAQCRPPREPNLDQTEQAARLGEPADGAGSMEPYHAAMGLLSLIHK